MTRIIVLVLAVALLGGCAIVPLGYGYRGGGYRDGYYQNDRSHRDHRDHRGYGDRGYGGYRY